MEEAPQHNIQPAAAGPGPFLRTIGYVRSAVRNSREMPPFGAPASLEIFPEFWPGMLQLEKHSHVWVLAWLHEAEREILQVIPRGVRQPEPAGLHGVFAVRSPVRPNPIGLTVARVLDLHPGVLQLERLDFLDGTPLVDLKPYFPSRDLVFSAWNEPVGLPADRAALRTSLWLQALQFRDEATGDLALGVRILEHFRAEVLGLAEPLRWRLTAPAARPDVTDALMAVTRATLGKGNLKLQRREAVRIQHEDCSFDYELVAAAGNDPRVILEAGDEDLFEFEAYGASRRE